MTDQKYPQVNILKCFKKPSNLVIPYKFQIFPEDSINSDELSNINPKLMILHRFLRKIEKLYLYILKDESGRLDLIKCSNSAVNKLIIY